MRGIVILICFLCFSIAFSDIDVGKRSVNLNALNFQFLPCNINDPVIELDHASLKKYNETEMVIVYQQVKYIWKDKSILFKDNKELGCYEFLCIKWFDGYCFEYKE